ncbi:hypothetical protein ABZP36_030379 [Zizania latifolia]
MASPASVTNLGINGRPCTLHVAAARAHWASRINFTGFDSIQRWQYAPVRLCRCMVITNLIEEKGVQFSSRVIVSVKPYDDNDLLLKPPQKPVEANGPPAGSMLEDRDKNGMPKPDSSATKAVEEGVNSRMTKTLKSVWRKGNPVPTVHKVIGLNNVPLTGDEFESVDNLDVARERANARADALRIERISAKAGEGRVTLSSIAASVSSGKQVGIDTHELNVILKVDFQGSIEAIRRAIQVLPQENVSLRFLLQAPGDVSVSDIDLAVASEGIIFGFNVKAPGSVKNYAKRKNVEIRLYKVIYDLIDDLQDAMEGLLELDEVGAGLEGGIGVDDFDEWEKGDQVMS